MCQTRYRQLSDLRWYSIQCVCVGIRFTVKVFVRRIPIYYNGAESVMVEASNRFGKVLLLQNFIFSQVFLTFLTPVPRNQPYERAHASYLIPFPRHRVTSHSVTFRVHVTETARQNERTKSGRKQGQHCYRIATNWFLSTLSGFVSGGGGDC